MSESFQTFESHVPFNLQFLMDFNLFGMNYVYLSRVKFRRESISQDLDVLSSQQQQLLQNYQKEKSTSNKWNLSNLDE